MKAFKYILIFIIFLSFSVVGFWYLGRSIIEGHLKEQISTALKSGDQSAEIKTLKLNSMFPLKLQLSGMTLKFSTLQQVSIERLDVLAKLQRPIWDTKTNGLDLGLQIDGALLETPIDNPAPLLKFNKSSKITGLDFLFSRPINLKAFVKSSQLDFKNSARETLAKFDNINMGLEQKAFLVESSPISLDFKTDFRTKWAGVDYKVPLIISSQEVFFNKQVLSAKNVNLSFSGLNMIFKEGFSNLANNTHEWSTQFEIADLGKLPTLPDFLPSGSWEGSLKGQLQLRKTGNLPPFISVSLATSPIKGQISVKNESTHVEGSVDSQIQLSFVHYGKFKLDTLKGRLDLNGSKVAYKNYLDKPAGVPMGAEINASFKNEVLQVESLSTNLHNLKANVFGKMSSAEGKVSNLTLSVDKTSLSGFEKYLPIFRSAPLSGFFDLEAEIGGNPSEFPLLKLKVNQFNFQDIAGAVDYISEDKLIKVNGPFGLGVGGSFNLEKSILVSSNLKINFTGDNILLEAFNKFYKKKSDPFKWKLDFNSLGGKVNLLKSGLITSGLAFNYRGVLDLSGLPQYDLTINIVEFNKTKLEKVFRPLQELETQMNIKGQLKAKGRYAHNKPIEEWPLKLEGDLVVAIPFIKIEKDVKTRIQSLASPKAPPPPPPLMAGWPLFQNSELFIKLYVDKFMYNTFQLEDIKMDAFYKAGNVSLKGRVNKAYDGHILVDSLSFDTLEALPEAMFAVQLKNFNSQKFIDKNFEDHKGTVAGKMNLSIKGKTPYPHGDWLGKVMAKGSLQLKDGELTSFNFEELANDSLAKIPGLGVDERLKPQNGKVSLTTNYSMAKGRIIIKKLDLQAANKSQLTTDGVLDLDLNCKLDGKLALTRALVRGSVFVANKDASNRLVTPVAIRGTLLQPSFSFSRETIDELLSRALKYETNQVQVKAKRELDERAKEEARAKLEKEKNKSKTKSLMDI